MRSEMSGYLSRSMKTFSEALLDVVSSKRMSLRAIATESGVSYEQLKKVSQGKTLAINIEDARRIVAIFGQDVEEFIQCPALKARDDLDAVLGQLDDAERRILLALAKEQLAVRGQPQQQPDEAEK